MEDLVTRLKSHRTVYTPYLGITECIANFEFLWDEEVETNEGLTRVVSVFKPTALKELKLEGGTGIVKENIPLYIDTQRIRKLGEEVVFNPRAEPVLADIAGAFRYPKSADLSFAFLG